VLVHVSSFVERDQGKCTAKITGDTSPVQRGFGTGVARNK